MQKFSAIPQQVDWRRAFWAVVSVGLALFISGCANSARRQLKQKERSLPKIVAFEIEGNKVLSDQDIFSRIQTGLPPRFSLSRKPRYDEFVFETDLQRIEALYRSRGYYDAKVVEHKITKVDKDEVKLWVSLEEGEPIRVEKDPEIKFLEDTEAPQDLQDFVTGKSVEFPDEAILKDKQVFLYENYSNIKEEILARITNRGYAQATVRSLAQVDTLNHKVYVSFLIDPGPLCTFGQIKFVGLKAYADGKGLKDKDLKRYLAFATGEPFTRTKLTATQQNLFDTGAFSLVNVEPQFVNGKKSVDILIKVEQVQRHRIQAGGGTEIDANSRLNLRARLSWLDRSVSGGLSKLQVSTTAGTAITTTKTKFDADGNVIPIGDDKTPVESVDRDRTLAPVFNVTGAYTLPYVRSPRRSFAASAGFLFDSPTDSLSTATIPFHLEFDRDLLGTRQDRDIREGRLVTTKKLPAKAFSYGYGYTFQLVGLCFSDVGIDLDGDGQIEVDGDGDGVPDTQGFCASRTELDAATDVGGIDNSLASLGLNAEKLFFQLGYFEQHLVYNRTDNSADPKKGYTFLVSIHEGAGPLAFQSIGEGFNYIRVLPEARGYFPLNKKKTLVLAGRLQLGALFIKDEKNLEDGDATNDNQNASPFPERFFLGGATSHRGFGFQGLSPTQAFEDKDGNVTVVPIGGNAMLLNSEELRFDTPFGVRFATFVDIGVVPPFVSDLSKINLPTDTTDNATKETTVAVDDFTIRTALGFGVRYVYGPLVFRADLAALTEDFGNIQSVAGFDDKGTIFQFTKFQISIGEAF
jgi:outer membrane protein assembly factor BamA